MTVYELITTLNYPVVYGHFSDVQSLPYFNILGAGQEQFEADGTYYTRRDMWQIEYYYTKKNPELEHEIEDLLLGAGYKYEKSEDIYLDDENLYVIYYNI